MAFTRAGLCWVAAASLMIGAAVTWPVSAQEQTAAAEAPAVDSQALESLSDDELEELVAPIALGRSGRTASRFHDGENSIKAQEKRRSQKSCVCKPGPTQRRLW